MSCAGPSCPYVRHDPKNHFLLLGLDFLKSLLLKISHVDSTFVAPWLPQRTQMLLQTSSS